jgi:hypothetical protein
MIKKVTAPPKKTRSIKKDTGGLPKFLRNVVPDSIDLRDRPYIPSIKVVPAELLVPSVNIPVPVIRGN